ncbi:GtrA family protein [Roseovarius sp. TE539]|uniref:GtrA family protein n=1 Tax=Roseovarius sp. TE539 TaxID=2249812 RepID=UPI000DDF395D|nr:GtrA family protein [Roseovarius sp. TE539]RBI76908.1 GtrA family protein [Roseovarius sp. TE539]
MSRRTLILRYAAFAVIATLANLAVQRMVLALSGPMSPGMALALAIGAGTIAGLLIKYVLDKRWIFLDLSTGLATHGRKFALYTAMGVVTTCIFWGTETLFWWIWRSDPMREAGAVLGLTVGYVVKYNLDRRYVFTDDRLGGVTP